MEARYVKSFLNEASSEELYIKYYRDIEREIYRAIISSDPTSTEKKNGKYCKWLLDLYRSLGKEGMRKTNEQKVMLEDLYKIKDALVLFSRYGNRVEKKQIQQYKDYNELVSVMVPFEKNVEEENNSKDLYKDIKDNQTEKVYEDSEWLVISPKTKEASCFWGMGTKWCTAATEDNKNRFNSYNSRGSLYIFIDKIHKDDKGRQVKYQFHFESRHFMDSEDNVIKNGILHFNKTLIDVILERTDIKEYPSGYLEFFILCGENNIALDYIIKNEMSNAALNWSKILNDDNIKNDLAKVVIAKRDILDAYNWAITNGSFIEEMRNIIFDPKLFNSLIIIKWCRNFKEDRDRGLKQIIKYGSDSNAYDWGRVFKEYSSILLDKKIASNDNASLMYKWYKISNSENAKNRINKLCSNVKTSIDALCYVLYTNKKSKKYINMINEDSYIKTIYEKYKDIEFDEYIEHSYIGKKYPKGVKILLVYLYFIKNKNVKYLNSISKILKYLATGKLSNDSKYYSGYWGTVLTDLKVENYITVTDHVEVTPIGYLMLKRLINKPEIIKYLAETDILQILNIPLKNK